MFIQSSRIQYGGKDEDIMKSSPNLVICSEERI